MSQGSEIWIDGTPTAQLALPDRGLDYGDGVFETILVHAGKPLFLDVHLDRLALGLGTLSISDCRVAVRQQLNRAVAGIQWRWAVLRLSVTRGSGQRGYAPSANATPRVLISITELSRDCGQMTSAATLCAVDIRLATQPFLAGIKHLNRLEQVLAAAQVKSEGVDEGVVLNQDGQIVSVVAGNLFLVSKGKLLTPRLESCGVLGTRRRLIIEQWAPAIGLSVQYSDITQSDFANASEVFYSNSLQTVRPIGRFGQQSWDSHGVCEALFECFRGTLP